MPVQSCTKGGKSGHKWGQHGHCYTGKDSEARAEKQGAAIKASQARRAGYLKVHKGKKTAP